GELASINPYVLSGWDLLKRVDGDRLVRLIWHVVGVSGVEQQCQHAQPIIFKEVSLKLDHSFLTNYSVTNMEEHIYDMDDCKIYISINETMKVLNMFCDMNTLQIIIYKNVLTYLHTLCLYLNLIQLAIFGKLVVEPISDSQFCIITTKKKQRDAFKQLIRMEGEGQL
ncbi:hypothetical protein ACJX0J_026829, partial [Zea mays]